jgi:transposase InsO family protein
MIGFLWLWAGAFMRLFRSRQILLIENLALRQQLAVFKRQHSRPRLTAADRLFWVLLHALWSSWRKALIVVSPDTVVRWHRAGFRLYWRLISRVRRPIGRRPVTKEIRELIFQMVAENPTWRAPRIHGEVVMLGFEVSERSVSRWMRRAPRPPPSGQRWLTFLRNHREAIAAMDFFSIPTVTFGVLYVFFIIGHGRRRILHFNVTRHPTSAWIVQQLREAFPYESTAKFLILDHDAKYGTEVPAAIRSMNITAVRTSVGCPWQNGVAERWVGSCRRELLDHVIAINESHLKRLLSAYVKYYHQDRTHCGLERQAPETRTRCSGGGKVVAWPRVGGLHHRYQRAA